MKRSYSAAINAGARAIVICDTAGHATPMGAFALVRFIMEEVVKPPAKRFAWTGMGTVIAGWQLRLHGCAGGGRDMRACDGVGDRGACRQYADGSDAGEFEIDRHSRPGSTRI